MANQNSLYLCHMTAEEKKAYNAKYYQEHKDYWQEYYKRENVDKRNAATINRIKSGSVTDRLSNVRQRPAVLEMLVKNSNTGETQKERRAVSRKTFTSAMDTLQSLGINPYTQFWNEGGKTIRLAGSKKAERQSTPDLNARTAAIQKARQQSARLSTPDLNARLKAMSSYVQPARASKLSQITSSAISKGKSIVNGLISLWKSGANVNGKRTK